MDRFGDDEHKWLTPSQWLQWIAATSAAGISIAAYAFATFETKEHFGDIVEVLADRLDRIENKLDRILEKNQKN